MHHPRTLQLVPERARVCILYANSSVLFATWLVPFLLHNYTTGSHLMVWLIAFFIFSPGLRWLVGCVLFQSSFLKYNSHYTSEIGETEDYGLFAQGLLMAPTLLHPVRARLSLPLLLSVLAV